MAVLVVLFAVQIGAIGYARTTDTRYFAWAPYDQISLYQLEVTVDGEALDPALVLDRYPFNLWIEDGEVHGRENRSIAHVHYLVERVEQRHLEEEPGGQQVLVVVTSSTNGATAKQWSWTS